MTTLIKIGNSELNFRLKLNYNNVFSRLMMLLGRERNIFADLSTTSKYTTWFTDETGEFTPLTEAPKQDYNAILAAFKNEVAKVRRELENSGELASYADDILEVPDNEFVFYKKSATGYRFMLAGWGCKKGQTTVTDNGVIKRLANGGKQEEEVDTHPGSEKPKPRDNGNGQDEKGQETTSAGKTEDETRKKPTEPSTSKKGSEKTDDEKREDISEKTVTSDEKGTVPSPPPSEDEPEKPKQPQQKKKQHVLVKVLNQNMKPVEDEEVNILTQNGVVTGLTDENGVVEVGNLPYHSKFTVSFPGMPDIPERAFEVEPKVETYQAFIKKYVSYSPVLFVEDQDGYPVENYNVKIVIAGQEKIVDTGNSGMVQLPSMQEGQKFTVIDSANFANSTEYAVTAETANSPYRFKIMRSVAGKVGITALDEKKKPINGAVIEILSGDNPSRQTTGTDGRAEFPSVLFKPGDVDLSLKINGRNPIHTKLNYSEGVSEYTVRLQEKRKRRFNWKWLMLLPLLLLLGLGGWYLWPLINGGGKTPTIKEMEKGVVMVFGVAQYYADIDQREDGNVLRAYLIYKNDELIGVTFDPQEAAANPRSWSGTGFMISKDGMIATNRHVADPSANEDDSRVLKGIFQKNKEELQVQVDRLNDKLQILGGMGVLNEEYKLTRDSLQQAQHYLRMYDRLLNMGDFEVKKDVRLYVAFTGNRFENSYDDVIACSQYPVAVGEPGGVDENDLAIIRIKKKTEIPEDAYIFSVPEQDPFDQEIPDNYEITVLGYNAGPGLQNMKMQDAIHPQAQHGKISDTSKKYTVGYDAATLPGSSGSPVLNEKGELVAINNSGLPGSDFNYGVRTKYLRELLDQVEKKQKQKQNNK